MIINKHSKHYSINEKYWALSKDENNEIRPQSSSKLHKLGVKRIKETNEIPKLPFYSIKRGYCGSIGWGVTDDKSKILNQTIYQNDIQKLQLQNSFQTKFDIDPNKIQFNQSTITPSHGIINIKRSIVTMLGSKEFLGLPGSRALTWDKALNTNVKEFHDLNIRMKRKKIQEEYLNLTKGQNNKTEPDKTKGKSSNNQTSSMKTSSISSKS